MKKAWVAVLFLGTWGIGATNPAIANEHLLQQPLWVADGGGSTNAAGGITITVAGGGANSINITRITEYLTPNCSGSANGTVTISTGQYNFNSGTTVYMSGSSLYTILNNNIGDPTGVRCVAVALANNGTTGGGNYSLNASPPATCPLFEAISCSSVTNICAGGGVVTASYNAAMSATYCTAP